MKITCNHCSKSRPMTSQNKDQQYCNRDCFNAYRVANPQQQRPKDSIPTGKFPLFV